MKKHEYGQQKNIIYAQLKKIRKEKGLTQTELAAKMQILNINIDQQMISRIEQNLRIVTDYELACFAIALDVSEQALLADFLEKNSGDDASSQG